MCIYIYIHMYIHLCSGSVCIHISTHWAFWSTLWRNSTLLKMWVVGSLQSQLIINCPTVGFGRLSGTRSSSLSCHLSTHLGSGKRCCRPKSTWISSSDTAVYGFLMFFMDMFHQFGCFFGWFSLSATRHWQGWQWWAHIGRVGQGRRGRSHSYSLLQNRS